MADEAVVTRGVKGSVDDESVDDEISADRDADLDATVPLQWSRHDQTHVEVVIDYAGTPGSSKTELGWDVYYFIPSSLQLDASTYPKEQVFDHMRSYVRASAPALALTDVASEAERLCAALPAMSQTDAINEVKLFSSRLRYAVGDEARILRRKLKQKPKSGGAAEVAKFTAMASESAARTREALQPVLRDSGLAPDVVQAMRWTDEHLSRVLEKTYVKLAARENGNRKTPATDAAIAEAQYRKDHGRGPVADNDQPNDVERVERRIHLLKRFASAVLWLDVDIKNATRWIEHGLHSIAAGIAMLFAVIATLLYGNPNDSGRLWLWGFLVVAAYMAKDRMKVALQHLFNGVVARRFPDRRWSISATGSTSVVARAVDKARFVSDDELPPAVVEQRYDAYRDALQRRAAPDSVLHYSKLVTLDNEVLHQIDPRYTALLEIMRLDVSAWLAHTDDAKRTLTLADPIDQQLFTTKLARDYDVAVVYRLTGHPILDDDWHSSRFVLDRTGIRKVTQVS